MPNCLLRSAFAISATAFALSACSSSSPSNGSTGEPDAGSPMSDAPAGSDGAGGGGGNQDGGLANGDATNDRSVIAGPITRIATAPQEYYRLGANNAAIYWIEGAAPGKSPNKIMSAPRNGGAGAMLVDGPVM